MALWLLIPLLLWGTKRFFGQELEWRARVRGDWRYVGRSLRLALDEQEGGITLQGPLGAAHVHARLWEERRRDGAVLRSKVLASSPDLPRTLQARAGSPAPGRDEASTGDPWFDQQVELGPLDAAACAALSHPARRALCQLLDWGARLERGEIICEAEWAVERNAATLRQVVRKSAALAELLSVPPELLHQRLARNALEDPEPQVRLRNLRCLSAESTRAPAELLRSTARSLLADVHPVRLLAARQLGAEGYPVLRALAADPDVKLEQRVAAVHGLGQGAAPDLEGLRGLLEARQPHEVLGAALETLAAAARGNGAALADAVVACTHSERESVRAAAARTLGKLAAPRAEPALLRLLADPSADVQRASVEALGAFASAAAVEPLLPLAQSLIPTALQQAARDAVRRIQSRLGDVEAGRLSLAADDDRAGAVDLAEPAAVRAGELSLHGEADVPDGSAARARSGADPGG